MDAIAAITNDHEEIRGLVDRTGKVDADIAFLLAQLRLRLAAHDAATETQVYRELLREHPDCAELVGTRVERHRGLEAQLSNVERTMGTVDLAQALASFSDNVVSEMDGEEATVLPLLRQRFTAERLAEMGRRYQLRWLAEMDERARQKDAPQEPTG